MRRTDIQPTNKSRFREQDRVFVINGQWWFTTREGEQGPYSSREAAEQDVDRYADMMDATDQVSLQIEIPASDSSFHKAADVTPGSVVRPSKKRGPARDGESLLDTLFRS